MLGTFLKQPWVPLSALYGAMSCGFSMNFISLVLILFALYFFIQASGGHPGSNVLEFGDKTCPPSLSPL